MHLTALYKTGIGALAERYRSETKKLLLIMKLIGLLIFVGTMTASAKMEAQVVSLNKSNASLEEIFSEIREQTGYEFIAPLEIIFEAPRISVKYNNASIENVLEYCFKDIQFQYEIDGKIIIISRKENKIRAGEINVLIPIEIKGRVYGENGPLAGVTIMVKGSNLGTITDENGAFYINDVNENAVLIFSYVGYETQELEVRNRRDLEVHLKLAGMTLDEAIVQAYGTTTRRLSTGSIGKVRSTEIETQPVTNPIAALAGRVPGVVIGQSSGVPGSTINIEIRGRSSLDLSLSRNDPLFVIDGVPFEPGNLPVNQLTSAANKPTSISQGGLSPLNSINPMDIESIEVLKDADATAIYGSRGANGVVLITTKRGSQGKTNFTVNLNTGWSRISTTMDMLNTSEYVAMRREAFANEGVGMTTANAPDVMVWDTARYTDFKKLLVGNTARTTNAQVAISGGNSSTNFMIRGSYHHETSVYTNEFSDKITSAQFNIGHNTADKKLQVQLTGMFSSDHNDLPVNDLMQYVSLMPNLKLWDDEGKLAWEEGGVYFTQIGNGTTNPLSLKLRKYEGVTENLLGNFKLSYQLMKNLEVRASVGYNNLKNDELSITPKASIEANSTTLPYSKFGNGSSKSWIAEPQVEWDSKIWKGKLKILAGSTLQEKITKSTNISASDYINDLLLTSVAAAGTVRTTNNYSQYRYTAFFGRVTYNLDDKYILNFTGRRDGSTRFGPGKRFASFGAAGGAWIFSREKWIKNGLPFLSFGKLRGSYGSTGNDQIGDYSYLDLWNSTTAYQGVPSLFPNSLFNPDYNWERTKKLEVAMELGFLQDRLFFTGAYYQNRSSNQLIRYQLPLQTGFNGVNKNFPALVENVGWELMLTSKNINGKNFTWNSSFNITIPKNRLVSFPGLDSSSYADVYKEGESLSIIKGYRYIGVNPETGVYEVEDIDKDGLINSNDRVFSKHTDPKLYGGLQNSINYKGFGIELFFEFKKQIGENYLEKIGNRHPGLPVNQPAVVLKRWQKPGDIAPVQRFHYNYGGAAGWGSSYLRQSDGVYSDASYFRLKNIALSYEMPASFTRRIKAESVRIYSHAQNLFVLTDYLGTDPEVRDFYSLPPLKTIVIGIQINF